MPLVRYFLYVGAVLLAVLVIADNFLPKMPVAESVEPHHPAIRLYSNERWPERIEFNTNVETITSAPPAIAVSALATAAEKSAKTQKRPADLDPDSSMNAREAFAAVRPTNAPKLHSADTESPGLKDQRKIVSRRAPPRMRLVWRQPSYGWYGSRYWW